MDVYKSKMTPKQLDRALKALDLERHEIIRRLDELDSKKRHLLRLKASPKERRAETVGEVIIKESQVTL